MMDVEAELLVIAKEFNRHIGAVEGFMKGQAETNATMATCLKTLTEDHQKIKREVFTIKSKVAFAASCVGTAVAVAWHWLLKKTGIES